jgi:hypothetical protein
MEKANSPYPNYIVFLKCKESQKTTEVLGDANLTALSMYNMSANAPPVNSRRLTCTDPIRARYHLD